MPDSSGKKHVQEQSPRQRLRRRKARCLATHVMVRSAQLAAGSQCDACLRMEMTLADVESDELIALLNRADGIGHQAFVQLLGSVARRISGPRIKYSSALDPLRDL